MFTYRIAAENVNLMLKINILYPCYSFLNTIIFLFARYFTLITLVDMINDLICAEARCVQQLLFA
jgi:hypothetical protein